MIPPLPGLLLLSNAVYYPTAWNKLSCEQWAQINGWSKPEFQVKNTMPMFVSLKKQDAGHWFYEI